MTDGKPSRYGFELRRRHRFRQRCRSDAAVLYRRVEPGHSLDELADEDRQAFEACVEMHAYNIYWYAGALRRERFWKWLLFLGTTAMLFVVPGSIFLVTGLAARASPGADPTLVNSIGDSIIGQLGIVVAGIVAVQKGMNTWIARRTHEGRFWKASSALKASLYTLEDALRGKPVTADGAGGGERSLLPEARAALDEATDRARAIVDEETQAFFDGYAVPQVDLAESLSGIEATRSLVEKLASPRLAERRTRLQALAGERQARDQAVRRREVARQSIELVDSMIAELRGRIAAPADDDEARVLKQQLSTLYAKRLEFHLEVIAAEAARAGG